jgi:hypothetical protein
MPDSPEPRARQEAGAALAAGAAATVVLVWLLHAGWLPLGIPRQWVWPVRAVPYPPSAATLATAGLLVLAAAWLADAARSERLHKKQAYAALIILALASSSLPPALLSAEPGGWRRAILSLCSDQAMGYLGEAVRVEKAGGLAQWLRATGRRTSLSQAPDRVATHPPGPVLVMRGLLTFVARRPSLQQLLAAWLERAGTSLPALAAAARQVSRTPLSPQAVASALVAFWVLLAALPTVVVGAYFLGLWSGGERSAPLTALLTASLPSVHVFMPSLDGWAAALAVWAVALWLLASKHRPWAAAAAGLVWGLGCQWSFGLSTLAVILALLARPVTSRRLVLGGLLIAGAAIAHLPLLLAGYNPLANFIGSMQAQRQIMVARSYVGWLFCNVWELVLFAGPALIALAAAAQAKERRCLGPVAVTTSLLLLLGATRGEVGRIWVFLMPLGATGAAEVLARLRSSALPLSAALLTALQVAMILALASHLVLVAP